MAIPTYNELLAHYDLDSSIMRETFADMRLRQFSLILDVWETLAKFLEMPNSDITNIKSQGDVVVQKLRMLECWKQRRELPDHAHAAHLLSRRWHCMMCVTTIVLLNMQKYPCRYISLKVHTL